MTRLVGLLVLLSIGGACRKKEPPPPPQPVAPVAPVATPAIVPDAARDVGTVPWRVDSVRANRWTDRPTWTVRIKFKATRLREVPVGTELRSLVSCLVGSDRVADAQNIYLQQGPIAIGESSGAFADHFYWSPLAATAIPTRCEVLVFAQLPGGRSDVIDHEVGRYCIEPAAGELTVSAGRCAPLAEAPPSPLPTDRAVGTVPWRLDRVNPERWTDRKEWVVRLYLFVTRLRDVPAGTELRDKLSCQVGSTAVVEVVNVGLPEGPIHIGESAPTFVDHFGNAKLANAPSRCELLVYAQMPGARPEVIDHEVGRVCIVPGGGRTPDDFTITVGACPPLAELPR